MEDEDEDEWEYTTELVTQDQIDALFRVLGYKPAPTPEDEPCEIPL